MSWFFTRFHNRFSTLFVLFCLLFGMETSSAETPSRIMSRAMIAMMDTMGDLAHEFKSKGNWSFGNSYRPYSGFSGQRGYPMSPYGVPGGMNPGSGWPGGLPLQSPVPGAGGFPLQGPTPYSPAIPDPIQTYSAVDGIWLGQNGEIVLVMYGHFRIYASAETYRDGRFEISGDRLAMLDPQSGRIMEFDYLLDDGRMILRSESGSIILFKQLPIPIPPYNLFSNAPSTNQQLDAYPQQEDGEDTLQ
ncbi:MAG: hypothetical protein KZQ85_14325 [Candidatus Thiodiazotropha sp. (ex Myrtea sp. 'scaly one' KF741663)]|nr:hypothetical protein [Candidatus Thiodiazotropha sp. (ex Myrtea sp. 'scaly one' KF741663)]